MNASLVRTGYRSIAASALAAVFAFGSMTPLATTGTALAASRSFENCMRQASLEKDAILRANLQLLCGTDQILDATERGFEVAYPIVSEAACELVDRPIYHQKNCP